MSMIKRREIGKVVMPLVYCMAVAILVVGITIIAIKAVCMTGFEALFESE